jgi:ribosome maturation factor RimP
LEGRPLGAALFLFLPSTAWDIMSTRRELQNQLFQIMEPAVADLDCELVAVEMTTVEGRRTMRISIDKPGGIVVKDCTQVNRSLSAMLDVEDPLDGAYDLEVSSPGLKRPLQKTADFERFSGYRVRVQLEKDAPGRRRFTGILKHSEPGFVHMDVDGEDFQLALELVEKAHLLLEIDEHRALVEQSLTGHATGDSP